MSVEFIDYDDLLVISTTATMTEITTAYRRAALLHHPDQVALEGEAEAEGEPMVATRGQRQEKKNAKKMKRKKIEKWGIVPATWSGKDGWEGPGETRKGPPSDEGIGIKYEWGMQQTATPRDELGRASTRSLVSKTNGEFVV